MILKPKYTPGDKVELISGTQWWINAINIYMGYYHYHVWNWDKDFLYVDEEQIEKIIEPKKAWFKVDLDNLRWHKEKD